MVKIALISCFIVVLAMLVQGQDGTVNNQDPTYPGRIILKIKPVYKSLCSEKGLLIPTYNNVIQKYNGKVNKVFPHAKSPEIERDKWGNKLIDITTIYEIDFNDSIHLENIIGIFSSFPETEYCQLVYLPQLLDVPNDPGINAQYYLNNIRAYQAWDLCKGDSTIIIGITDTGIENAHSDLIDNIAYNFNDPINSIDDDFDGFVDNFRGWDMGNNDNSPEWNEETGANAHGVYVSGLAAARTNNANGIASPGYHTKFLPIKINDSTGVLLRAYESIVYAADHNCSVINCSWGGQSPHPFGKDMIDYATYNKNALVVAAAGNNGNTSNSVLYPAAFDNVLCVAASNQWDLKWDQSCYGPHIDVCAPGENVYLTYQNNGYTFGWGTSFASPITAGCAAVIKSWYGDTLNALQIGEILRLTADNIDTVAGNIPFAGKLGGGRINLYKALLLRDKTDSLPASVRFINYNIQSQEGQFTKAGDTVYITGDFINYLYPSYNLIAELSTTNSNIQVIQSTNNLGQINMMEQKNNGLNPFVFVINENANYDIVVTFKIHFTDTFFDYNQYFKITLNPSYTDIDTNKIKLTLASNGKLGYNNFYPLQGNGLIYNQTEPLIYEAGIAIAQNNQKVSRSFRSVSSYKIFDGIHKVIPAFPADERWACEFSDSLAGISRLGINVKLDAMEWNSSNRNEFVILNYTLKNNNSTDLNDIYFGLFCDWDISNSYRNKTLYNNELEMFYAWYTGQTNLYTGSKLLTNFSNFHYAFDSLKTLSSGGQETVVGLSSGSIFQAMTTNKDAAGTLANGNDISNMISYGPIHLLAHDSITLSFALLASNSLYNLEESAIEAQFLYDSLYISNPEISILENSLIIYPNPAKDEFHLLFFSSINTEAEIRFFNVLGDQIYFLNSYIHEGKNNLQINTELSSGSYFVQIKWPGSLITKKILVK